MALPLCVPGVAAWLDFFAASLLQRFGAGPRSPLLDGLAGCFWPLFWAAVATAVVSVILYAPPRRTPRPPVVIFNLVVNVSGLLFGAACILLATL